MFDKLFRRRCFYWDHNIGGYSENIYFQDTSISMTEVQRELMGLGFVFTIEPILRRDKVLN